MKRLLALIVMFALTTLATTAFAGELKMIGTVSAIRMVGGGAEMTVKDRKTDAPVVLQVRDHSNMEKIKDRKVRVGTNCAYATIATAKLSGQSRKQPAADQTLAIQATKGLFCRPFYLTTLAGNGDYLIVGSGAFQHFSNSKLT